MGDLKQKVVKGAIWTLLERVSVQVVQFVVSMVLARLLAPNDYGTVALTNIFFAVAAPIVGCGFSSALIQKKNADALDFNSVFYFHMCTSSIVYIILFIIAPYIADFYNTPILSPVVRVAAVTVILNGFIGIQEVELVKKMLFHLSFRISLLSTIMSGAVGITLAFYGLGVWALIGSTIVGSLVGAITRWFFVAWRPRFMFSFRRLRPLFSYGSKILASAVLDQIFSNLNGILIGKYYSKADLAYVNKGYALPGLAANEFDGTIGRVSFPALIKMQDDRLRLRESMRRMMRCSTYLVFPTMVMLAISAKPVIMLMYGEKWLPAVPYTLVACFSFVLLPFHTINLKGIMAVGRSDVFLVLEIIKKVAKLLVILVSFRYGVFVFVAASAFALGPLSVIINAWPNRKLLGYTIGMQIWDVLPAALACFAEATCALAFDCVWQCCCEGRGTTAGVLMTIVRLMGDSIAGFAAYFAISYWFRLLALSEFVGSVPKSAQAWFPWLFSKLNARLLHDK